MWFRWRGYCSKHKQELRKDPRINLQAVKTASWTSETEAALICPVRALLPVVSYVAWLRHGVCSVMYVRSCSRPCPCPCPCLVPSPALNSPLFCPDMPLACLNVLCAITKPHPALHTFSQQGLALCTPWLSRVPTGMVQAWGYADIEAYYSDINGLKWIPHIKTPTLFLSAMDDPFLGSAPLLSCYTCDVEAMLQAVW